MTFNCIRYEFVPFLFRYFNSNMKHSDARFGSCLRSHVVNRNLSDPIDRLEYSRLISFYFKHVTCVSDVLVRSAVVKSSFLGETVFRQPHVEHNLLRHFILERHWRQMSDMRDERHFALQMKLKPEDVFLTDSIPFLNLTVASAKSEKIILEFGL